jgi:hypothetical protein
MTIFNNDLINRPLDQLRDGLVRAGACSMMG